jgi:hypothetical protein
MEELKAKVAVAVLPSLTQIALKLSRGGFIDALDPAVEVLGVLVDAAKDVIDVFKEIGLIKKKAERPRERLEKADHALAAFDKKHDQIGPLTPQQYAERQKLVGAREEAFSQAYDSPSGTGNTRAMDTLSFRKRYAELDTRSTAEKVASFNPWTQLLAAINPQNDFIQKAAGENDGQRRLRTEFQGQEAFDKYRTKEAPQTVEGAVAANREFVELSRTVAQARSALDRLAKPAHSITGGTN